MLKELLLEDELDEEEELEESPPFEDEPEEELPDEPSPEEDPPHQQPAASHKTVKSNIVILPSRTILRTEELERSRMPESRRRDR
jgi:hypothetical protein